MYNDCSWGLSQSESVHLWLLQHVDKADSKQLCRTCHDILCKYFLHNLNQVFTSDATEFRSELSAKY